jgi:cardiolipin synthase A/B
LLSRADVLLVLSLLTPIVHGLGVIGAAHAVMSVRSSRGAVAWSISLLTVPWLALPLYAVLGRRRFYGYREVLQVGYLQHRQLVRGLFRQMRDGQVELPLALRSWQQVMARFLPITFLRGNQIELLVNAPDAYAEMLAGIQQAKSYILLQVYIVHDDAIGNEFRQALIAKAQQGVRVYLLYDGIGSQGLPRSYVRSLRAAGVQVEAFSSRKFQGIGRWRRAFQLNFRNHRKLLVIDGARGFTGGLNIGDEYLGNRPPLAPWRDTSVGLRGAIVPMLQAVFLSDWYWVTGDLIPANWESQLTAASQIAAVFPTGAADGMPICKLVFIEAINQASDRLWIASPYFVPDDGVLAALQLAALRGVDVRVLLPNRPDHWLVYLCSFSYYPEMLKAGVKLYRYIPGFMHQKVMLVDEELVGIGSVNLDNRSFFLNFEVTVWLCDRALGEQVAAMLGDDFRLSRLVQMGDYEGRSWGFKLCARIARLFGPIL